MGSEVDFPEFYRRDAENAEGQVGLWESTKVRRCKVGVRGRNWVARSENICMYVYMRTTLVLEDGLFKKAKQEAVEAGVTLSEVMNTALRQHLRGGERKRSRTIFAMPVFGERCRKDVSGRSSR